MKDSGSGGVCKVSVSELSAERNRCSVGGNTVSYNERELYSGQHTISKNFRSLIFQQLDCFATQHRVRVKNPDT